MIRILIMPFLLMLLMGQECWATYYRTGELTVLRISQSNLTFVESVTFKVYHRWGGKEIYSYSTKGKFEPNFFIDWNGTDSNGILLPNGTYYYSATVTFDVLDPKKRPCNSETGWK